MFLFLSLCLCGLLLQGDAQDRAALWRGNDRSGRCQYTFSVPSPTETSCPQTGGPEVEGLKVRLNLLEVLVSRLTGGATGAPQGGDSKAQSALQEALNRVVGEKNLLQGEKERLQRELEGLQRRVEDMKRETEKLRNRPCPPQTPMVPPNPSLQDSGMMRPAGGKGHTQDHHTHSELLQKYAKLDNIYMLKIAFITEYSLVINVPLLDKGVICFYFL